MDERFLALWKFHSQNYSWWSRSICFMECATPCKHEHCVIKNFAMSTNLHTLLVMLREREILEPAEIWTQDLSTSQVLLPLSHCWIPMNSRIGTLQTSYLQLWLKSSTCGVPCRLGSGSGWVECTSTLPEWIFSLSYIMQCCTILAREWHWREGEACAPQSHHWYQQQEIEISISWNNSHIRAPSLGFSIPKFHTQQSLLHAWVLPEVLYCAEQVPISVKASILLILFHGSST